MPDNPGFDPNIAELTDDNTSVQYRGLRQIHSYERFEGVVVMPVAFNGNPAEPPEVLRAFAPYNLRRVNWSAGKDGASPPIIPAPGYVGAAWTKASGGTTPPTDPIAQYLDNGDQCVGSAVTLPLPGLGTTQTSLSWTLTGSYLYVSLRSEPFGFLPLPTGDLPFETGVETDPDVSEILFAPGGEYTLPYFSTVFPSFNWQPSLIVGSSSA